MILQLLQKPRGEIEIRHTQLVSALKVDHTTQTCRIAIIVRNHDRWIERLKVENEERSVIEGGERFHNKGHTFGSILLAHLRFRLG